MPMQAIKQISAIRSLPASTPQKVFVEKEEGNAFEYSDVEPGALKEQFYSLLNGYYAKQNYINLFYSVPEIFAPVHEIAKRVSDCNWQLCKDWNDEVDYNDKDFNRLFSTPNPLMDMKDLIYQAVCYEILTGRQFFYMNRPATLSTDYENILSFYNLHEPSVDVVTKKNVDIYSCTDINDLVVQYKIGTRVFDVSNVIPIYNLNLSNSVDLNNCVPQLKGADMAIKNLVPVYAARGIIYIKRGMMGLIVSKKSDAGGTATMTKTEKKNVRAEMNRDYGVTGNRDTIGLSEVPVEFVKTSMSLQEMMPFDETLADALVIYKTLRVPQHLVPRKEQSTFNNTDAEMRAFYTDVISAYAKRYASIFSTRMGFNLKRRYVKADYSHIDYLQADYKKKAEVDKTNGDVYLQRFNNGVGTLNQWIVSYGGTKSTNPLYEKMIFEMTPEELAIIKTKINEKSNTSPQDSGTQGAGG